jgi:tetraacyldisaccharide 4'-kinase
MPEAVARRLQRAWYRSSPPLLLLPLCWLYRGVIAVRAALYRAGLLRTAHPGVPVVVVGNITVGGTGKTPVVQWLASRLHGQGIAVGIASRGHRGSDPGPRLVGAGTTAAQVGDEALMLARATGVPVCVARRRIEAARELVRRGCELVLCDDGLQHLALRRDFAIAVVDARRGLGNGALLPAGPLREPASRLEQVDLVLLNGDGSSPRLPDRVRGGAVRFRLEPGAAQPLAGGAPRPLRAFAGVRVHAVAGIGDPERFFISLREAGLDAVGHAFADHHAYVREDLDFGDDLPVLMTQKDAVKCEAFADGRMWCVPAGARFAPADAERIVDRITDLLPGGGPPKRG